MKMTFQKSSMVLCRCISGFEKWGFSTNRHVSFQGSKSASSPGPQPPQAVGSQQQEEDYHDTQPPDVSSHTIHGTNGMSTYMNG